MAGALPVEDLEQVLAQTRPLWADLRGGRVFLTGGTGFFGCWLVESFLHANRRLSLGAELTVLSRDPRAFLRRCPHLENEPALRMVQGDVRDFSGPEGAFDAVIHAATESAAAPDARVLFEQIVHGTGHVLDFAARHGAGRFLLTSSGAVYGQQPASVPYLDESFSGAPDPASAGSVYGEAKRAAELLCSLDAGRTAMACTIARCFTFVGPHLPLDRHFAVGNFIGDALAGRPIRIKGDGRAVRSYLYAADLATWLWTILLRAPALTPIHVGSEEALHLVELAERVARVLGATAGTTVARQADPTVPVQRYVPSTRRAEELLGLRATVPLEEAIRRTAAWYRAQRQG